jgi:hypothetical protein
MEDQKGIRIEGGVQEFIVSVPRLRGRGEQGIIVTYNRFLSTLNVATPASSHTIAQPADTLISRHSLLTTASQARHAPQSLEPNRTIGYLA